MTDTEKIVTKTKEYILKLYSEGLSTLQSMVTGLKNGIDFFVGRKDGGETIKDEILSTCITEFDEQTKDFNKVGYLKKLEAIRADFKKFVNELNIKDISDVLPITFERRLELEESKILKNSLKDNFDFGSWNDENYYWEPITKTQNKVQTIYFEYDVLKHEDIIKIADILESISGKRIHLLTEEKLNYEVDTSLFGINWIESAYCDIKTNWLIYISHEGTITFAGEELIKGIENELTEIMKHKNPWN